MSHIITSHQLIGSATLLGSSTEHSLKRCYLAKKIAKLNRLLDAHMSVLDKKLEEISAVTASIDRLNAAPVLATSQKNQLKQLVKSRSLAEKWVLSSNIMRKINEIRHELEVLNESTLDTYDDYTD